MVRAVLFDLDDTLFDHRHGARTALQHLHGAHGCFASIPFDHFERQHSTVLEELHRRVVAGELPLDVARRERFRRLFEQAGVAADDETVNQTAVLYRDRYLATRQAIAGAVTLLPLVRERARIGVVSNNLLQEQQDKMRHLGFDRYVDVLVVSEEAGISKPDPRIFALALDRLGCTAGDAVMVGDSWQMDVLGARAAGIRAIWFNRLGVPSPDPHAGVAEIRALEPAAPVLAAVFDAHRN
jgi:putative hydrolase of the HAD superfamily